MIKEKYITKRIKRLRLRKSIRKKINGTPKQPRMIIFRSNKYIYTQVLDDVSGKVLASASSLEKEIREKLKSSKDMDAAKAVGEAIAERLKKKKIKNVIFDRNVYPFMGRVKVLADAAREKGIKF